MSNKRKQIFVLILLIAVVMSPMFATTMSATSGDYTLNLSWVKNAVNLIVGVFAGGYVLLKAALDIFHAVRNSSEDPNGLKKAIGGLVLNIAILAGFFFVLNYVLDKAGAETNVGKEGEAQTNFFNALSGSLVMVRNAVGL